MVEGAGERTCIILSLLKDACVCVMRAKGFVVPGVDVILRNYRTDHLISLLLILIFPNSATYMYLIFFPVERAEQ